MVHPAAIQLATIPHTPIVSLNLNPMFCFPTVSGVGGSSSLTPATHYTFSALDHELNVQPSLSGFPRPLSALLPRPRGTVKLPDTCTCGAAIVDPRVIQRIYRPPQTHACCLQGYLSHKKTHPPRTLLLACA